MWTVSKNVPRFVKILQIVLGFLTIKRIGYVLLWSHVPQIMMIKQFSQVHTLPPKNLFPIASLWRKTCLNTGGVELPNFQNFIQKFAITTKNSLEEFCPQYPPVCSCSPHCIGGVGADPQF